jgi:cyclophilin family peptidyl-prolyl cis-trans isomerase/HEAT repeat protein
MKIRRADFLICLLLCLSVPGAAAAGAEGVQTSEPVLKQDAEDLCALIIRHEDERKLDRQLIALLDCPDALIRQRAAMAIGRIGNPDGVAPLVEVVSREADSQTVRRALFALGEIESPAAVPCLLAFLKQTAGRTAELRGRAAEALGKIAAHKEPAGKNSNGKESAGTLTDGGKNEIGSTIEQFLGEVTLTGNNSAGPAAVLASDRRQAAMLALTALFRSGSAGCLKAVAGQLGSGDPNLSFTAAALLSRSQEGVAGAAGDLLALLADGEPLVRVQAARALGAGKDKKAVARLLLLLQDRDERVAMAAVSALGSIADTSAVKPLLDLSRALLNDYAGFDRRSSGIPSGQNELLLVASALGEIKDERAIPFLKALREASAPYGANPEVETALAGFGETVFFELPAKFDLKNWQTVSAYAQGLGQLKSVSAVNKLLALLESKPDPRAIPEILNALAKCKAKDLPAVLLAQLKAEDIVVRSTAAGLLADLDDSSDLVAGALAGALADARRDKLNDARLAIIEAAAKLKHPLSLQALVAPTRDPDYIVRRRALELMRETQDPLYKGDLQAGPVETGHNQADWQRLACLSLAARLPIAVIHTKKGDIEFELFAQDAPMMVDNFMRLSRSGFYNGLTFMRVVPNFVIQGGDPRNDMNGGPGYQVRCEINQHTYLTGTVGIALSGKDTGGSQFFVAHMPQPHLDGGYTVIGQISPDKTGVLNSIARGDVIEKIEIRD